MAMTEVAIKPWQAAAGTPTRVQVVDDHEIFADLLAMAIGAEPDFECVGIASSGATAYDLASRARPDIIVMDIQLGVESGLDAARRIRNLLPLVVIVVVSAHRDPNWVARAAQAGASAFAPKSGSLSEMLSVLRGARNGSMLVAPSLFEQVVTATPEPVHPAERLTAREQDVLRLMGEGAAPPEIAKVLSISVHTCRGYVKAIHQKLGVSSQLEAVVKAQRLGLIHLNADLQATSA
jgi:DNA-binding NarL/FixJ family response regulator